MIPRAVKAAAGLGVDGDVEVNAPFFAEALWIRLREMQRVREIFETTQWLVLAVTGDDLMKIDRFIEGMELRDVLRRRLEFKRGAEMQLAKANAGTGERREAPYLR